jgi:hypothetical protein
MFSLTMRKRNEAELQKAARTSFGHSQPVEWHLVSGQTSGIGRRIYTSPANKTDCLDRKPLFGGAANPEGGIP